MKSSLLIYTVVAVSVWLPCRQTDGQTANVTVTLQFANGETATITDFSDQIGVHPAELVTVKVQFPTSAAGQPVVVDAPDGGATSLGTSIRVADPDGSITFTFLAHPKAGQNRLNVRIGFTIVRLQFWVMDSQNPQNNPSNFAVVSHS